MRFLIQLTTGLWAYKNVSGKVKNGIDSHTTAGVLVSEDIATGAGAGELLTGVCAVLARLASVVLAMLTPGPDCIPVSC